MKKDNAIAKQFKVVMIMLAIGGFIYLGGAMERSSEQSYQHAKNAESSRVANEISRRSRMNKEINSGNLIDEALGLIGKGFKIVNNF